MKCSFVVSIFYKLLSKKNLIWYMIDICFAMLVETWWKEWWWPAGWINWQWQQLQSRWVWRRKWHSTWEPGERRGGRWSAARWWDVSWRQFPSSILWMVNLYCIWLWSKPIDHTMSIKLFIVYKSTMKVSNKLKLANN